MRNGRVSKKPICHHDRYYGYFVCSNAQVAFPGVWDMGFVIVRIWFSTDSLRLPLIRSLTIKVCRLWKDAKEWDDA